MIGNRFIVFILTVVLVSGGLLVSCGGDKEEGASLISGVREQAGRKADQAKMQAIRAAATHYTMETGKRPQSLDDLVREGYLDQAATVDHDGKKLSFSPESLQPGAAEPMTTVTKTCGKCGGVVSPDARVGDRCPHCGVVWGAERRTY